MKTTSTVPYYSINQTSNPTTITTSSSNMGWPPGGYTTGAIAVADGIGISSGATTVVHELGEISLKLERIERLLGILLSDPAPEKLEQHRALKDAYAKYKMIENLLLGNEAT